MPEAPRRYRRKPFAVFENGTRIYAPTRGEDCYRVTATDALGGRLSHKFVHEDDARGKARELEAYLASSTLYGRKSGQRTVGGLAELYMEHLSGKSTRYRERQDGYLRCWILPRLSDTPLTRWTPAMSEKILADAISLLRRRATRCPAKC